MSEEHICFTLFPHSCETMSMSRLRRHCPKLDYSSISREVRREVLSAKFSILYHISIVSTLFLLCFSVQPENVERSHSNFIGMELVFPLVWPGTLSRCRGHTRQSYGVRTIFFSGASCESSSGEFISSNNIKSCFEYTISHPKLQ